MGIDFDFISSLDFGTALTVWYCFFSFYFLCCCIYDTRNTQTHDCSLSWLGTGTSI